jgi:hypothetical protein
MLEEWNDGRMEKTGDKIEQEATTKTRKYESTKEEGGQRNLACISRVRMERMKLNLWRRI